MSNPIHFVQTEFKSKHGYSTWGYRAYDDNCCAYSNNWENLYDDPLEFLAVLIDEYNDNEVPDEVRTLLEYIKEHECGFNIDSEYFDFEEVKELFEELE